ncbi:hypothetical protein CR513_20830, partial [Mucuna pruriens]
MLEYSYHGIKNNKIVNILEQEIHYIESNLHNGRGFFNCYPNMKQIEESLRYKFPKILAISK